MVEKYRVLGYWTNALLLSKQIKSFTDEERLAFEKLVEFYIQPVEKDNAFVELKIWKVKISNGDVNTKTGLDALMKCSKTDFPNIHFLIKIFCTLPVSTATPERSFSTLKRLKSYLRSTMNEVMYLRNIYYKSYKISIFVICFVFRIG